MTTLVHVVLYGHAGCPGTARARAYMRAHWIAFEDHDIGERDALAEMRRWNAWAMPLVVVAGRFAMVGFDAEQLEALLARAGGGGPDGA